MPVNQPTKDDIMEVISSTKRLVELIADIHDDFNALDSAANEAIKKIKTPIIEEELAAPSYLGSKGISKSYEYISEETDILLDSDNPTILPIIKKIYFERENKASITVFREVDDGLARESIKDKLTDLESTLKGIGRIVYFFSNKKRKDKISIDFRELKAFTDRYDEDYHLLKKKWPHNNFPADNVLITDFNQFEEEYYEKLQEIYGIKKAKLKKSDYDNIVAIREKTDYVVSGLMSIVQFHNQLTHQAKTSIHDIKGEDADKQFRETTLTEFDEMYPDVLADLAHLRKLDLFTLEDFTSYMQFTREDQNNILVQHLNRYYEEIIYALPITFNTSKKSDSETQLLNVLYLYVNEKQFIDSLTFLLEDYEHLKIEPKIEQFNHVNTYWKAIQLAKDEEKKKDFDDIIIKILSFMNRFESPVQELADNIRMLKSQNKESVWADFNKEAASYYAVLDKYFKTGSKVKKGILEKTNLSQKILNDIDAMTLKEAGLKATLRSWQSFGAKYALLQRKVLIGDEMGLGKTLISIATMSHLYQTGSRYFLVICPASIMENWMREVVKHSDLIPYKLHGPTRDAIIEKWREKGGVAITTYATSQKLKFSPPEVLDVLTVDEAHYAKNPLAKRSKHVYQLSAKSDYTIFLTGTPLENKTAEMTALIHALQPKIAYEIKNPKIHNRSEVYRKEIAPVYLRRTKDDVRLELPQLSQIEEWAEFGKSELENYKQAVAAGKFMTMRRVAWSGGSQKSSPKLQRLIEICEEAAENKQKVIVFSFFKEVLRTIERNLPDRVIGVIDGNVPINERQEMIDAFRDSDDKNVIVAQINTAAHGLNMQFTNIIIFCEPQMKPSIENQAVARAYRMGQTQNVFVYRLLTPNSIDELMLDMLDSKQKLFDAYADKSFIHEEHAMKEAEVIKEEKVHHTIITHEQERLFQSSNV